MTAKSESRFYELDLLRGVAALWVVLFHYLTKYNQLYAISSGSLLGFEFPDGTIGVYLFFMISGFVIFMTIQRSRTALDFIVSRFSRLFPAYWTAIALTATAGALAPLPGQSISHLQVVANLTMLQSYFYIPPVDGVYWTLGIELSFYFLILTASLSGLLRRPERCAWLWLSLAVLGHFANGGLFWMPYRLSQLLVLDYAQWFVLGIVFYLAREYGYTAHRVALIAACLGVEAIVAPIALTAVMAVFVLLFHLGITGRLKPLTARPLLWLGGISYPLYLTHQMIGYLILRTLIGHGWTPAVAVAVTLVAALLLASAIRASIERPAQRAIRDLYHRWRVGPISPRPIPG